jgi:hypothetical protein
VTTIHDTIKALLNERATCCARVDAIDRELTSVQTTVTAALANVTPLPAKSAEAAAGPDARVPKATHDQARRAAAHGIRFAREIKTALANVRPDSTGERGLSSAQIARASGEKREDIKRSLTLLLKAGSVVKIGARGPSVRWTLPGAGASRPRVSASAVFETVFPQPGNPKASPREAIEGARA